MKHASRAPIDPVDITLDITNQDMISGANSVVTLRIRIEPLPKAKLTEKRPLTKKQARREAERETIR